MSTTTAFVTLTLCTTLLLTARRRHLAPKLVHVALITQTISFCSVRLGEKKYLFDLRLPEEAIEPIFSGAAWAGTVFWLASARLANYIASQGRKAGVAIELGAGIGVPSFACVEFGLFDRVFVTEQPPLDGLLMVNAGRLCERELESKRLNVLALDWAAKELPKELSEAMGGNDVTVLIADCIFEGLYGDSWKYLALVVSKLLRAPHDRALNCVERRKDDGVDSFIAYSESVYGISSRLVQCELFPEGRIIELYEMTKL